MRETTHRCPAARREARRLLPPGTPPEGRLLSLQTVRTADASCPLCGKVLKPVRKIARELSALALCLATGIACYLLSIPVLVYVLFVLPFASWLVLRGARKENARLALAREHYQPAEADDGDDDQSGR